MLGLEFVAGVLVTGLIGGIGIFVTLKVRPQTAISYQMKTTRYFDENIKLPKGAEVIYGDQRVSAISKTTLILWNSGQTTLHGDDIVEVDPLRLEFGVVKVAVCSLRGSTQVGNAVVVCEQRCKDDSVQFGFSFDFLSGKDGFVVDVYHSSSEEPKFSGTCKGVSGGPKNLGVSPNSAPFVLTDNPAYLAWRPRLRRRIILPFVGVLLAISTVALLGQPTKYLLMEYWPGSEIQSLVASITEYAMGSAIIGFILYIIATVFVVPIWLMRRRFPKSLARYLED